MKDLPNTQEVRFHNTSTTDSLAYLACWHQLQKQLS